MGGDRLAPIGIGHDDTAQPGFQVGDRRGQAQHRHDLAGYRDFKAVLPRNALHLAAQAADDVPQLPVVHVHSPLPGDLLYVDAQGVALLDVVVQHRRQQIVGRADGVEIPGEMEVNILHGDHLGIAASGRAPLDAEHRPQGRLPQRHVGPLAQPPQAVGQPHGGGRFSLSGGGGGDGSDQNQLAVGGVRLRQKPVIELRLIPAIQLQVCFVHTGLGGNVHDGARGMLLCNFDVRFDCHMLSS